MLKQKLEELKGRDPLYKLFGARNHKYRLHDSLSDGEIQKFESKHKIKLPREYWLFLMLMGNGGAGPYYGVIPLEYTDRVDIAQRFNVDYINISEPFKFTEKWNLDTDEQPGTKAFQEFEEMYDDDKWITGMVRLSHFGCGVFINLIVNGPEYGNMWVDDRANDGGIYPDKWFHDNERIGFFDWYELWLDRSIEQAMTKYGG